MTCDMKGTFCSCWLLHLALLEPIKANLPVYTANKPTKVNVSHMSKPTLKRSQGPSLAKLTCQKGMWQQPEGHVASQTQMPAPQNAQVCCVYPLLSSMKEELCRSQATRRAGDPQEMVLYPSSHRTTPSCTACYQHGRKPCLTHMTIIFTQQIHPRSNASTWYRVNCSLNL